MARILAIGTATLDLIFTLTRFPAEDSELRAEELRTNPGGNAANTLVVLSQLGHACAFGGVLADGPDSTPITERLDRHRIDLTACRRVPGRPPTSCVLLNREQSTRTIVHYRDLPEYGDEYFRQIDLAQFDWVHFEGRDAQETTRMVQRVRDAGCGLTCSIEVEKPRPGIEAVFADIGMLVFSRAYVNHLGFDAPRPFLCEIRKRAPQADLIVTWGKDGAYGLDHCGELHHSPAFPPVEVKDTLGAGDTFNAGLIDAYLRGIGLAEALSHACRLAGNKCGQVGLEQLRERKES